MKSNENCRAKMKGRFQEGCLRKNLGKNYSLFVCLKVNCKYFAKFSLVIGF